MPRYLLTANPQPLPQVDDDAAEGSTSKVKRDARDGDRDGDGEDGHASKKARLSGAERRKLTKDEKKQQRGQNKGRRWGKVRDELDLCWRFASEGKCDFGAECVASHLVHSFAAAYRELGAASTTIFRLISLRNRLTSISLLRKT